MLKKQIIFTFSLYLLFFNILSFPMEEIKKDDDKEKQLIVFNQHQLPLIEQSQQPIIEQTIPDIGTIQADHDIQASKHFFKSWFQEVMGLAFVDSIGKLHEIRHRIKILPKTDEIRILLDGPPGSGKSIIAKAFAGMLEKKIKVARASNANTKRENSLGSQIKSIIKGDKSKDEYAIFIKKVDQVDDTNLDYGAIIGFMDYIENKHLRSEDKKKVPRVIFLATTHNRHSHIKKSIEGRLRHIKVNFPDYSLRATIFRNYFTLRFVLGNMDYFLDTHNCNNDQFIQLLANRTKDFSVKDIKKLLMLAEKFASEGREEQKSRTLQQAHVLKAHRKLTLDMHLKQPLSSLVNLKDYCKNSFLGTIAIGICHKCCRLKRSINCYNTAYLAPLYSYPASIVISIKNLILYCHQSIFKKPVAEKLN